MGFGDANKQLCLLICPLRLKAAFCPHDVPNGKWKVPKCTQYVVAQTLLSVTMQLRTAEQLVFIRSLKMQTMNDSVKKSHTPL
jgi:hypothetical protein